MSPPSEGLNAKQQRFANVVLSGMASKAYRAAGYTASTDRAAEAGASRLLRNVKVAAYLTDRRASAAQHAGLSLAQVLTDVAKFANDEKVDGGSRVSAFRLLLEHIAQSTARSPLLVPETAGETTITGEGLGSSTPCSPARYHPQANEMLGALGTGCQIAHGATIAADLRGDLERSAAACPDRLPIQPKWFKRDLSVQVAR